MGYIGALINLVGLEHADLQFRNDYWLPKVKVPVLILHSQDDPKIPAHQSEALLKKAEKEKDDIRRIVIDGFGHNDIYKFGILADLVSRYWNHGIGIQCKDDK